MLSKTTHTIDAYHPRENEFSTVSPDDRLQIVYNLYTKSGVSRHFDSGEYPDDRLNLVFIHGTQMCKEVWEYMIEKFFDCGLFGKDGERLGAVVSLDPVNHGESCALNKDKLGFVCTWSDGGKDVVQVLKHLNLQSGTTIVLGHSMGGAQALYAALHEPHMIDSVVLFDPVGYFNAELLRNENVIKMTGERMSKLKRFVRSEFKDEEDYLKYMKTRGISRTFHPRIQADYIKYAAKKNADGSFSFLASADQQLVSYFSSQFAMQDIPHLLPVVKPAMLHVDGELADWNPPEAQEMWTSLVQRSEAAVVKNGHHLFPFDQPDETFDAIVPFIQRRLEQGTINSKQQSARRSFTDKQRKEYVSTALEHHLASLVKGSRPAYSKL